MYYASAVETVRRIRSGELTPVEVMEATVRRIEMLNPTLNAFCTLYLEQALARAAALTEEMSRGVDPGPLAGLPIGVKDLEDVRGMVTSCGSVALRHNVAGMDSVQVARLKQAGAIVLGKTNVPEFGFTAFTKNRVYGISRNPWNPERTPGGSSGGSAAAVTAGMAFLATGSDAGGSIRIPASYCGCFGMKPTAGRIPLGPSRMLSMDTLWILGPLTRSVADAALYLDCTTGYHPADPGSLPRPTGSYLASLENMPAGLRIAFSPDLGYARVEREVARLVEAAAGAFEDLGHRVELWPKKLPDPQQAWNFLMNAELHLQYHDILRQHRQTLGRALVQALDQAGASTLKDWIRAFSVRTELNRILADLFEGYDLLLTPTMPTAAFGAKGPPPSEIAGEPIPLLGAVAFTYPFNLSGHPAASVPAGLTSERLPVGLQIIGPHHQDGRVLQAARAFERARPWPYPRPVPAEASGSELHAV